VIPPNDFGHLTWRFVSCHNLSSVGILTGATILFVAGIEIFFGFVAGYLIFIAGTVLLSLLANMAGEMSSALYRPPNQGPKVSPVSVPHSDVVCLKCWETGHHTKEFKRRV
jgi:hypothetical protein